MFKAGDLITASVDHPGLIGYRRNVVLLGIKVNPGDVNDPFFGEKPRMVADLYDTKVQKRCPVWWDEEDWKRVEPLTEQFKLL